MFNYKLFQLFFVDQDDFGFYGLNVFVCRFRIVGGGDEDFFLGFFVQQCFGEVVYFVYGYGIFLVFGLNVDDIQFQVVFFDDVVYVVVIGVANSMACIGMGIFVVYGQQKIYYQLFEELWGGIQYGL